MVGLCLFLFVHQQIDEEERKKAEEAAKAMESEEGDDEDEEFEDEDVSALGGCGAISGTGLFI